MILEFVNIGSQYFVQKIVVYDPRESIYRGEEYYYPDGLSKGYLWWKKNYIMSYYLINGEKRYLENLPNFKESDTKFIKDGKIWEKGRCEVFLIAGNDRVLDPTRFYFRTNEELKKYIQSLNEKWGVGISSLVCFSLPTLPSLYDYLSVI